MKPFLLVVWFVLVGCGPAPRMFEPKAEAPPKAIATTAAVAVDSGDKVADLRAEVSKLKEQVKLLNREMEGVQRELMKTLRRKDLAYELETLRQEMHN